MEKMIKETFDISKITTKKKEIKKKGAKLCINVPKEYYYSLEKMKLDCKMMCHCFIPSEGIIEQLLTDAFYNKSSNEIENTYKKIKIFYDKYYKEHAEQSLSFRIPIKLYADIQKAKIDGTLLGYKYSINCIVNYVIFYNLINEYTKITPNQFIKRLKDTQIKDFCKRELK